MAINPVDIRHKEFRTALSGFNKNDVRAFLDQIADEMEEFKLQWERKAEEAIRQHHSAEEEARGANNAISDLKRREELITRTLVLAEKTKADIIANARQEGENIIHEAELKAKKTIQEARQYLSVLEHQYLSMKEQKRQFLMQFRIELQTFMERINKDPLLIKEQEQRLDKEFQTIKDDVVPKIEGNNESTTISD
jgi:cell division initiation protein